MNCNKWHFQVTHRSLLCAAQISTLNRQYRIENTHTFRIWFFFLCACVWKAINAPLFVYSCASVAVVVPTNSFEWFIYTNLFEFITLFYCLSSAAYISFSYFVSIAFHHASLNGLQLPAMKTKKKGEKKRKNWQTVSAMIWTNYRRMRKMHPESTHRSWILVVRPKSHTYTQRHGSKTVIGCWMHSLSIVSNKYNNFMSAATLYLIHTLATAQKPIISIYTHFRCDMVTHSDAHARPMHRRPGWRTQLHAGVEICVFFWLLLFYL